MTDTAPDCPCDTCERVERLEAAVAELETRLETTAADARGTYDAAASLLGAADLEGKTTPQEAYHQGFRNGVREALGALGVKG